MPSSFLRIGIAIVCVLVIVLDDVVVDVGAVVVVIVVGVGLKVLPLVAFLPNEHKQRHTKLGGEGSCFAK